MGAQFLQNYYSIYDFKNKKIGLVESNTAILWAGENNYIQLARGPLTSYLSTYVNIQIQKFKEFKIMLIIDNTILESSMASNYRKKFEIIYFKQTIILNF